MPLRSQPGTQLIQDQVVSGTAAVITFSGIPAGYKHLRIEGMCRGDTAATTTNILATFNNDTGTNYSRERILANTGTLTSAQAGPTGTNMLVGNAVAASTAASHAALLTIDVPSYATTAFFKTLVTSNGYFDNTNWNEYHGIGFWASTVAINRIDLTPGAGNFITGSQFTLYALT